jgi:lipoyl-dependent peroxiredoxin
MGASYLIPTGATIMTTLYTAHATTTAGREGHSRTDDGLLDLKLTKPGGNGGGTNPEQLFACGYSACFGSAVEAVAKNEKVAVEAIHIHADVHLHKDDAKGFYISVELNAELKGVDAETARKLVEKAHHVCPYSKATRGNIDVTLKVNDEPLTKAA